MPSFLSSRTGRDGTSWPVLLLLLAALAPLAGMAWMLRAALESEQLAVRQRLADAYRVHLERAGKDVNAHWGQLLSGMSKQAAELEPAEAFKHCVERLHADSVIVWDEQDRPGYPQITVAVDAEEQDLEWSAAERLEFADQDVAGAANLYREIAAEAVDEQARTLAEQALARCLLKLNNIVGAREIWARLRTLADVRDRHGRSVAADAEMRLLETAEAGSSNALELAASLIARLNRYGDSDLSSNQRRFLMHRVRQLSPAEGAEKEPRFPMLEAEDLAAAFLAAPGRRDVAEALRPTPEGVWSLTTADGRVTALYRRESVVRLVDDLLENETAPRGVSFAVWAPGEAALDDNQLMAASLAPIMPGWRLAMLADGGQVFDEAASRRRTLLITIGAVLVGVTASMLWLAARGVQRQLQVAQLKNDLVATVSHELKTPLASTRLLVDTLLEDDGAVSGRTREYLELISQENARLTRLIDNFLTFSRMERGKRQFAFEPVDVSKVAACAVAAVRDRFHGSGAELGVEVKESLWVRGDEESLVTALINLLDNAWKYSPERKHVQVRARRVDQQIVIEVEDNGLGLTPRAAKRAFERFFQVDQQLSRSQGGCGLGLSIVKYIVDAHGGSISVESTPGEGSTFAITLPLAETKGESESAADWSLKRPVSTGESGS